MIPRVLATFRALTLPNFCVIGLLAIIAWVLALMMLAALSTPLRMLF